MSRRYKYRSALREFEVGNLGLEAPRLKCRGHTQVHQVHQRDIFVLGRGQRRPNGLGKSPSTTEREIFPPCVFIEFSI